MWLILLVAVIAAEPTLAQSRASKRHVRAPSTSPAYRRIRTRWHKKAPRAERRAFDTQTLPPLTLVPVNGGTRVSLQPQSEAGDFATEEVINAEAALAWRADESTHPIHPRLLTLVYQALLHFRAPFAWVVSGYRANSETSRHRLGHAVDLVLPGVSDRQLAAYFQSKGFVGVGLYPVSGFVHLDVREQSFFWIDRSGPNQRPRVQPILKQRARAMDRKARRQGQQPPLLEAPSPQEELAATKPSELPTKPVD
jgi:hypothetical protein